MNTTGNIPSPTAPFLGDDGRISQAWWQFMVSLFSRTGSAQGVDVAALLQVVDTQQATIVALRKELEDLRALIKVPEGYSNVTIAGTARKIPYYSN